VPDTRERALERIPYGLHVVGSADGSSVAMIIANWATQVSFDPPMVAVAIEEDSRMRQAIEASGYFSLKILPSGSQETARAIARSRPGTPSGIGDRKFVPSTHGTPFLAEASACIECRVAQSHRTGDHRTFFGEVLEAVTHREGDVLTLKETGWRYRSSARKRGLSRD